MDLPASFTTRIRATFGQEGQKWIDQLPDHLGYFQGTWSLTFSGPPLPPSYHILIPCQTPQGQDAILKLGVPNRELCTEIEALRFYNGMGAVQLLTADKKRGGLLLEAIKPGTALIRINENQHAAQAAADLCEKIWQTPPLDHPFPTVEDWGKGFHRLRKSFQGSTGPFPVRLVDKAEKTFDDLLSSMGEPVLLHGDLHHRNILQAQREPWLVIDPKGVVGEPAYEIGAFLRNPIPRIFQTTDFQALTTQRLEIFSERLSLDPFRMLEWGFAQTVLSAWWSYEEQNPNWKRWISLAELFSEMVP